jgi:hypothetical protein
VRFEGVCHRPSSRAPATTATAVTQHPPLNELPSSRRCGMLLPPAPSRAEQRGGARERAAGGRVGRAAAWHGGTALPAARQCNCSAARMPIVWGFRALSGPLRRACAGPRATPPPRRRRRRPPPPRAPRAAAALADWPRRSHASRASRAKHACTHRTWLQLRSSSSGAARAAAPPRRRRRGACTVYVPVVETYTTLLYSM